MMEFSFGKWSASDPIDPALNFYGLGFKSINVVQV